MASTASCSATRRSTFGRRVGVDTGRSRAIRGARRGVPGRAVSKPRVSVLTIALAGSEGTDVNDYENTPKRLKIFSVNDGASPRSWPPHTPSSFERSRQPGAYLPCFSRGVWATTRRHATRTRKGKREITTHPCSPWELGSEDAVVPNPGANTPPHA
jgi:hypothetical protein